MPVCSPAEQAGFIPRNGNIGNGFQKDKMSF